MSRTTTASVDAAFVHDLELALRQALHALTNRDCPGYRADAITHVMEGLLLVERGLFNQLAQPQFVEDHEVEEDDTIRDDYRRVDTLHTVASYLAR